MTYLDKAALKVVGTRPIRPDGVDKVIGRATFGADMVMPGMLWGKIKRSPHAHARIVAIKTDKAQALPGVKAVVTAADFPEIASEEAFVGEGPMNFRDLSYNCMARGKVLYDGHAVAAVAATSPSIAEEALDLIEVQYEVLPYVIDVEDAMKPDAPVLHDDLFTQGVDPKPAKPSNTAKRITFAKGDIAAGWKEAEVTIERRYTSQAVHQSYIEPHACIVSTGADNQCTIFSSSQGQFMVRAYCAKLLGIDVANIRAIPAEIGGGFGGKTLVYMEPVALALSKKSGRPVKIVMSREEVFRGTGPAAGGVIEVKLGAYRAPGAPNSSYGVESCMDELAQKLEIDPLRLREINAAKEGTKAAHGPTWTNIGYQQTLEAAKNHPHMKIPLGPNQGRGIASGFWFNIGGESAASVHINEDGTASVVEGNPDIGG